MIDNLTGSIQQRGADGTLSDIPNIAVTITPAGGSALPPVSTPAGGGPALFTNLVAGAYTAAVPSISTQTAAALRTSSSVNGPPSTHSHWRIVKYSGVAPRTLFGLQLRLP